MSKLVRQLYLGLVSVCWIGQPAFAGGYGAPLLDPNLSIYRPVEKIKGELKLGGSNTLSHVAAVWIASFEKFYPDAKITIEVNGSRAAVTDVKAGKTDIGLLSRRVREEEINTFHETFGYPPTVLTPCLERTAIFARRPGSRAPPMIEIRSCPISGTSSSNNAIRNSLIVRLANNCGPRTSAFTSYKKARKRSPGRTVSP